MSYLSSLGTIGCVGVVCIIVLLAIVFILYDLAVWKLVHRAAVLTRNVEAGSAARVAASLKALRVELSVAPNEDALLAAGLDTLRSLFPDAPALAVGCSGFSTPHVFARTPSLAHALTAQLGSAASSAAAGMRAGGGAVLRSGRYPADATSHSDVRTLRSMGVAGDVFTLALSSGAVSLGFVLAALGSADPMCSPASQASALRELADVLGAALFMHRAAAALLDGVDKGLAASGVVTSVGDGPGAGARHFTIALDPGDLSDLDAKLAADGEMLRSWDLDASVLDGTTLRRLAFSMLHAHGLLSRFGIPAATFASFFACLERAYNPNPFHCLAHAFNVAHVAWLLVDQGELRAYGQLEDVDLLALLLGALLHDVDHRGTTNAFEVNSGSPIAHAFNDRSVLENHHAVVGLQLLADSGVLSGLSPREHKLFCKTFLEALLATDMWVHKRLVADMQAHVEASTSGAPAPRI